METTNRIQRAERVNVDLNVSVCTVLETRDGIITNLSESGAKISGKPFNIGEQIQIDADGSIVWARVRWTESDRMGVQFETPMPAKLRDEMNKAKFRAETAMPQRATFGRRAA